MGSLLKEMKGRERAWGGMSRVGLIGLLRGRGCEYLSISLEDLWEEENGERLLVEGRCCGSHANCVCRLGLTDFLRGKLVESLKEEEKKQASQ